MRKAWVDYLTLRAPFDGVITARNANTFDFVLPTTGRPDGLLSFAGHLAGRRRPRRSTWSTASTLCGFSSTFRSRTPTTFTPAPRRRCWPRSYRDEPIAGHGHAHVVGAEHEEPHAPRRD